MSCLGEETVADYWFDDLPPAELDAVEEHLMACAGCSARLEELIRLRDAVHGLVRSGAVPIVVGRSFAAIAAREGLRVREYVLGPGERVACTVTPDDDLLLCRLRVDLRGVPRVDLVTEHENGHVEHAPDLPVDREAGEVLVAQSMPALRALPTSVTRVRLQVPDGGVLGEYTFSHTAHPARG